MQNGYEVVICGAGIAGISAAHYLAERGQHDVLLVDERGPLELTSSRSTECYRNWWPDPDMVALMNHSIDLLERLGDETANAFGMNRRGYLYLTADEQKIPTVLERARKISGMGAGPVRIHPSADLVYVPSKTEDCTGTTDGADVLLGSELIQQHFPGVTEKAVAGVHVRRAGWMSAQQLGMTMLEFARRRGVLYLHGRVTSVLRHKGRISGVRLSTGETIRTRVFVNAAGPYLREVGLLAGSNLPVHTELHLKVAFRDSLGVIHRDAPLLIWDDQQYLPWNRDERDILVEDAATARLTEIFPPGAHTRPEGGAGSQMALMLWEYDSRVMDPVWPPPLDALYPEVVLRGLATMLPGLRVYFGHPPRPQVDGGYYTKTEENRPLVGPTEVEGSYVLGALSGYGIMSACGVGDLLAAAITGEPLPSYAAAFSLERYADPAYLERMKEFGESGQL